MGSRQKQGEAIMFRFEETRPATHVTARLQKRAGFATSDDHILIMTYRPFFFPLRGSMF
jgi:hypothetical protein